MRTTPELLQLLKEAYIEDEKECRGLCNSLRNLWVFNKISGQEWEVLAFILQKEHIKRESENSVIGGYWAPRFDRQMRLDWLDLQIKLYI